MKGGQSVGSQEGKSFGQIISAVLQGEFGFDKLDECLFFRHILSDNEKEALGSQTLSPLTSSSQFTSQVIF